MDNKVIDFDAELENLIKETTKLEFPFLAGEKKKEEILMEEKLRIDNRIDYIVEKYYIAADRQEFDRKKIWDKAKEKTEKKFDTLPFSLRVNSFFFQEMMHEYAEKQVECVKQMTHENLFKENCLWDK